MSSPISRRTFIRNAALAGAGLTILPSHVFGRPGRPGPNDQINLGFIGCGKQSGGLGKRMMELPDARMVAACDVYPMKLENFVDSVNGFYSKERKSGQYKGCTPYKNYQELLAQPGIDAVIICTPDHWHGTMGVRAANAGKHIYCEKPLTLTVAEGRELVKAARINQIAFQTGSMQRSDEKFRIACELVRNGYIGALKEVKVTVGGPPVPYDQPTEPIPDGLDWEAWIGPAPMVGFNHALAPGKNDTFWPKWRNYREFGGGGVTDWGAHMFDIAQWGLGMDQSGPVEFLPAGADRKFMTLMYANGVPVTHEDFGRGQAVRFIGTEGSIDVSRSFLDTTPESLKSLTLKSTDTPLYRSTNHYQDWVDAIRTGKRPICDVETGHRSASVCNLINIAYELNRPLKWDPVAEVFIGDKEANTHLSRKARPGNW